MMLMLKRHEYIWGITRIALGWVFLWAFLDKFFGLGFATSAQKAWLAGGSPTEGFLLHGTKGPFASFYQSLAGVAFVDWLFMMGLLLIGLSLLLGIFMTVAGYSGALMMILMFTAGFILPQNNPLIDDHIIYGLVLVGLAWSGSGRWLGLGDWWASTSFVRKYPFLA